LLHGKYREKIPRYSVVPWFYFNFNDTILCRIIVIFRSSGIKYVLSPIIDVTIQPSEVFIYHKNYCTTNGWNSLPFSVVTAPSVNSFKNRLDINTGHHKNLDTIGKQNYQEPGVEAELNFEFFECTVICSK